MRRVWSIILTMAALGWLLPLGISPAWSYYPPLLATATFGPHVVTRQVHDPNLSRNDIVFTSVYLFGDQEVTKLRAAKRRHCLGAPVGGPIITSPVASMTQPWTPPIQVSIPPFRKIPGALLPRFPNCRSQMGWWPLWPASRPPAAIPTGHFEFRYTTYDPAKQAWQMRSWSTTAEFTVCRW